MKLEKEAHGVAGHAFLLTSPSQLRQVGTAMKGRHRSPGSWSCVPSDKSFTAMTGRLLEPFILSSASSSPLLRIGF